MSHPALKSKVGLAVAIYHLRAKVISRGQGQSAVAAAAYRSAQTLTDYATGEKKVYSARASRVVFAGIFAPADAPAWVKDREQLWNAVERIEHRKNSAFARELELSLPHELNPVQRLWLVQDFAREEFVRRHLVVDVAIHLPDRGANVKNHHVHFLVVERQIGADGFSSHKDRTLQKRQNLRGWRERWASLANRHLARHGHAARIDHRSYAEQGVQQEPGIHLGHIASEIERRGGKSKRGDMVRAIKARNAALPNVKHGEFRDARTNDRREDTQTNERHERTGCGAHRTAESTWIDGGPHRDPRRRVERTGGSGPAANGGDRANAGRYFRSGGGGWDAQLRWAIVRSTYAIADARRAAAEAAECVRLVEVPIVPQRTDIWGVGQLPSPPR